MSNREFFATTFPRRKDSRLFVIWQKRDTVSKAGVLKFLHRYQETGTIVRAPGTDQASKLTDQICEIIKDQMTRNYETTGMELQKLLKKG